MSQTIRDGADTYVRIHKQAARARHAEGRHIVICPVKLYPFGHWRPSIVLAQFCPKGGDFDKAVQEFEFHNCTNETGTYAAFWMKVDHEETTQG